MRREALGNELRKETDNVHVSAALRQRTLLAAQGKENIYMMKKISYAVAFALLAVLLCAAALAAANRWGMLDFVERYAWEHYIPEDAQDYVLTDVLEMENEWVTVNIRELYYDGRISRMTADVTPKGENVLLVGEDVCLSDLFINLTHEYVMDGENDMRSVYQVIRDEGYGDVYVANVSVTGAFEDMIAGSMDYVLGDDGTLTIFSQEEYATDLPERNVTISAIVMPFDQPLKPESYANYERRSMMEAPLTLKASIHWGSEPMREGEIANVYVNEAPAEYPSVGVRVDRLLIEVKPQEIYATLEYTVTDRERYDALDGGLWFEYIDPESMTEVPHAQRLKSGLTGGGSAGPVDGDCETATCFRQQETLGRNELHDTYTIRAYNVWEKNRYETQQIVMRPATEADLK